MFENSPKQDASKRVRQMLVTIRFMLFSFKVEEGGESHVHVFKPHTFFATLTIAICVPTTCAFHYFVSHTSAHGVPEKRSKQKHQQECAVGRY